MRKFIRIGIFSVLLAVCVQAAVLAAGGELLTELNAMVSLYGNGKYHECIASADALLARDGALMAAHQYKALAYFKQKDYGAAIAALEGQLRRNPANEPALYNLACLYSLTGEETRAADALRKVMALSVKNKIGIKKDLDFYNIRDNIIYKNIQGISVTVGGQTLFFDVPPTTVNGRTMLPVRAVFDALGAATAWDGGSQTVTAVKGDTTVALSIGSDTITVNGQQRRLDAAPILTDGRTLVPVRLVSEAFGAVVTWDGANEIVEVLTQAPRGNADYDTVRDRLDSAVDISPVNGKYAEPYALRGGEAKLLVIAKDGGAAALFDSLSDGGRARYLCEKVRQKQAELGDCGVVYMEFISEGRVYYAGVYREDGEASLTYYENGIAANTVVQDVPGCNYRDYYGL
ncbi:MAG: hypothetical protein LBH54_05795 [Clostridiales bacterium]|nr:hypothetical protein [Clostridiales bacterium]